jgi:hypothetical protein
MVDMICLKVYELLMSILRIYTITGQKHCYQPNLSHAHGVSANCVKIRKILYGIKDHPHCWSIGE